MEIQLHLDTLVPKLRLQKIDGTRFVFDPVREKWMVLEPEEFVRQLVIIHLIEQMGYNRNRITIERGFWLGERFKRYDVLVLGPALTPFMLIECKAPQVPVNQDTFEQIARYNLEQRVDHLLVTNGHQSYCCAIDYEAKSFTYLDGLPPYQL